MAGRRALPGTVVPWSPDFPRRRQVPAAAARPSGTRRYGLLGSRKQQGEQLRTAFSVDDPIDNVGAEAALESDHSLLRIGHVIAEALEREQEPRVGPVGINQVPRRA